MRWQRRAGGAPKGRFQGRRRISEPRPPTPRFPPRKSSVTVSPAEAEQEAKQEGRPTGQTVAAVSPGNTQATGSEPRAAAKTVKRPRLRQASCHHSDGRALALMTMRTIEFPDDRRVTQLLPYRSCERVLAFDPDE